MNRYLLIVFLLFSAVARAHDVHYSISQNQAYIVDIYYADGTKFAYESYEIYKPNDTKTAYQVGRTNASGRIAFVPDSEGKWLIKAFSDDGHGVSFDVNVEKTLVLREKRVDFFERFSKPVFGLGIILIIFAVINLFAGKKKRVEGSNNN